MARALVRFERSNTNLPWTPSSVFLATSDQLEGRALPGSEERDHRLEAALAQAEYLLVSDDPDDPHTYEEWIGWAVDRFETGYFSWATEVAPADTVDALFEREVAGWVDATPTLPPSEPSFPVEPVGTRGGLELLELTEGVIFSVDRETEGRIYGVVSATDGDPVGFTAVQTSFRKDRVLRRTPLSRAIHPLRGADGSVLRFAGYHGWSLGARPVARGIPEAGVLGEYPVPKLGWPDAPKGYRDLRVLRDRFAGALIGGAIGDGLGSQVDGMSRSAALAKVGPLGVRELPSDGGNWSDATALSTEVARSLVATGGRFDLDEFRGRIAGWVPVGHGGGPALPPFIASIGSSDPWYTVPTELRASDYGAAVRIGAVALVHAADTDASRLLTETVRCALLTHRGTTGVAGAVAIAAAVGYLVRCASTGLIELDVHAFLDFVATAISTLEVEPTPTRRPPARKIFLRDRIRRIETWLGREPAAVFERTWTGAPALESVPAAIYCFLRRPERPIEALRTAANATHETAAIGAMTGTLAGAWLGADRLRTDLPDWWAVIERRDELLALADELVDTAGDVSECEPPPLTFLG